MKRIQRLLVDLRAFLNIKPKAVIKIECYNTSMKIVFTGGGTGGHFYPIIAVAQEIRKLVREEKLIDPQLYFLAPNPYNKGILYDNQIAYRKIFSGKQRIYSSILNFVDKFKLAAGVIQAIWTVFWIYPDVIFSKGGWGSVPVVFAGRILGIPIVIHESDSAPGRANQWASKFADKIAVSYPDAANYFDKEKVAWTGNPVRDEIEKPAIEGGHEYLGFDRQTPTILILGGSSGAKFINDSIIDVLPDLTKKYQIIHQVGKKNYEEMKETSDLVLDNSNFKDRYKLFDYLNNLGMRMSAGAADLIISRAGSTVFEIAAWGKPSILIPITESNNDHQRKNAYNYLRQGGCVVIEENNLTPEILMSEIDRLFANKEMMKEMSEKAKGFYKPDAGRLIAKEIIDTLIKHES
jgi:UDP-N-acetylglucosamine--N-acetylmuramyl-(pentapeptide) pyrophosphoryl-undecaprenol N-acetylglucosamine transferase